MHKFYITCLVLISIYCFTSEALNEIPKEADYEQCLGSWVKDISNDCDECCQKIHKKCNHETEFTEQEIENVRLYLIKRFAKTNPKGKPCSKLYIRKDFKCMSDSERKDLFDVFRKLYKNGFVEKLTKVKTDTQPGTMAWKFLDGFVWHKTLINALEKEMIKINPNVKMPYWDYMSESFAPWKSMVWDTFGRAGNKNNDYCVTDGLLGQINLTYPRPQCMRRQWCENGKMPFWAPTEWTTSIMQMGVAPNVVLAQFMDMIENSTSNEKLVKRLQSFLTLASTTDIPIQLLGQFFVLIGYTDHFRTHLSIGGWNGAISDDGLTNDLLFYPYHEYIKLVLLKWQLQNDRNLLSETYDLTMKYSYDEERVVNSDVENDIVVYFNSTIKEAFEAGYGELCYIHQELIGPINRMLNGTKEKLPTAVQRLQDALPAKVLEKYFPQFALHPNNVSFWHYALPEVGNCNPKKSDGSCRKMPIAPRHVDFPSGRRNWHKYQTDKDVDITPDLIPAESLYIQFMEDMNNNGYCSPYI